MTQIRVSVHLSVSFQLKQYQSTYLVPWVDSGHFVVEVVVVGS